MNKLVSIIMPNYNCEKFVGETIKSVINQTYTNWEILFVDDCSTDNSIKIAESFKDNRIRIFKNEKNSGAAVSRNWALREAKGEYIAFLDSDDIWVPEKLEKQIKFMEENGYKFSYSMYEEMSEDSVPLGKIVSGPKKINKRKQFDYCWQGCLTVMYHADTVGLVQIEDIKKNNDYAIWLKVCLKADCYLLSEVLAKYRKRSGSISRHGYGKLIKWHYKLFREAEKRSAFVSFFMMLRNLFFGLIKKTKYVKGIKA
ncbi:MAG: glycosyltransferase family 2 protein [Clostridiales bacterium]|nr:glycosyltransferase family 2 protein [Clostridiales bacterium]